MAAKYQSRKVYQVGLDGVCNALRGVGVFERIKFSFQGESAVGESKVFNLSNDVNLASWGEKITVTVTPMDSGTCVDVLSECALPTQIIDWGKNKKNVEAVFSYLDSNAHTVSVISADKQLQDSCFCANCGTKIQKTDLFCYNCGTKNGLANDKGN